MSFIHFSSQKMVVFCICCFPTILIAFLAYFPVSSTFNRSPAFSFALQQFQQASSHFISHSSEKNRPPAFSFALQRKNSHSSETKWLSSSFILIPAKIIGLQRFHSHSSENIWLPASSFSFQRIYRDSRKISRNFINFIRFSAIENTLAPHRWFGDT